MGLKNRRAWAVAAVVMTVALAAACGGAATPPEPATTTVVTPLAPNVTTGPTPIPTGAPTTMPSPTGVVSAQDSMTLVINEEPLTTNPFPTQGGIAASPGKDNMVDPLTWQSGDDLRIVPTTATTSWEQLAPDKWRF
jgi:hypothetical protein